MPRMSPTDRDGQPGHPGEHRRRPSDDPTLLREVLLEAGQACLDWANDSGYCHICSYDGRAGRPHDDECPLRKLT